MTAESIAQIVTVLVAVLGIIWHQQRSIDKLRDDFHQAINGQRDDFNQAINGLRDEVASNGQRLARIEGFLGIGMPTPPAPELSKTSPVEPVSTPTAPDVESAADG